MADSHLKQLSMRYRFVVCIANSEAVIFRILWSSSVRASLSLDRNRSSKNVLSWSLLMCGSYVEELQMETTIIKQWFSYTYQYKRKKVPFQYGCFDCLSRARGGVWKKYRLGSPRRKHFGFQTTLRFAEVGTFWLDVIIYLLQHTHIVNSLQLLIAATSEVNLHFC